MSPRARATAVLVTALLALAASLVLRPAGAQVVPIFPPSSTTTTGGSPEPTSAPETTTTTSGGILPPPETTTTTAPPSGDDRTTTTTAPRPSTPLPLPGSNPPPSGPGTPPSDPTGAEPNELPDGSAAGPAAGSPLLPPEAQAIINSVKRTGPNNTRALLEALTALEAFGLTPLESQLIGMGRFPIAGYASYVHDWLYPRYGPGLRFHKGTDVFAAMGTPVRSPANGHVSKISNGGLGGLSVYVTDPRDGTYFYMTHLSAIPEGLHVGQVVGSERPRFRQVK